MKIVILCVEHCEMAIRTMEYFKENGIDISLVVIETSTRYKVSSTQQKFYMAHREYERSMAKRGEIRAKKPYPLFAEILWSKVPLRLRIIINPLLRFILLRNRINVSSRAKELDIPVAKVKYHSSQETKALLEDRDIQYALLTSSFWLIKEPLLSMKKTKIINAHCAKLPENRSLDSLPWSVLANDEIGLTSHFVDGGIDTGPILLFTEVEPKEGDNLLTLRERVDSKKPEIFYKTIQGLYGGSIKPISQIESQGVHHSPMTVDELLEAERCLQKRLLAMR